MAAGGSRWTDEQVDQVIGNLLRYGVLAAALVTAAGAVLYLAPWRPPPGAPSAPPAQDVGGSDNHGRSPGADCRAGAPGGGCGRRARRD